MPSPVQSNCDAHDTIANGQCCGLMRTRPCVRPLRFSLQKSPRTGSKKVSVGVGKRKISRTQLQLSEEWKVWRTQLQLSEECGKHTSHPISELVRIYGKFEGYGQVV
ncbi:hypothetical protein TNCV_251491 [Trichonephila clavipes]|nr:hypothetical protein TNCV_251491 [Trichonephila clavipes]